MFALCVEASHERGMGHLFRALALAEALESRGAKVRICLNEHEGALRALAARGWSWRIVPLAETGGDWEKDLIRQDGVRVWVDDRLDTDYAHARRVLDAGARLVTFDDRGSGAELADFNVVAVPLSDDEAIKGKSVLTGLAYMVLDPAIARYRHLRTRCESTVVSMGGSDTYGVTVDVVRALCAAGRTATVVLGPGFEHDAALEQVLDHRIAVKRSIRVLAHEFAKHDLAITSGGMTPYEANAAGLPCMVIATEPWEVRTGEVLARMGGSLYAGWREGIDFSALVAPVPIAQMSRAALAGIPVDGAAQVAVELMSL